jgi:hypothetical protein
VPLNPFANRAFEASFMGIRSVVVCALVGLCATAHGATVWTGTNFRVDASAPVAVGVNLQAITLTVVGLNGALPNAFDGVTGGATGITTTGNLLAQVTEFAPLGATTPTLTLSNGANSVYYPVDTHFLVQPPAIISTVAPIETVVVADNTNTPAPTTGFGGYGDSLTGQFALSVAPATTWDFAYLAVPAGTAINLNFRIAGSGGSFPNELVEASFLVPEPSTIWLVALGVLAMIAIARRRRV